MHKDNNITDIVKRYLTGKSSREELDSAMSLFEDPYHNLELRPTLYQLWNCEEQEIISDSPNESFKDLLNEIHHKINLDVKKQKKSKLAKIAFSISKIAAILIIGVFFGIFVHSFGKTEPVFYTSVSPKGSISQMILPDNTLVYLNSGSELKYLLNSESENREVFLNGEAWFQVSKNEKQPFIVHTVLYDVSVLGTEFNIKAYDVDNVITTTLEEGSIQIISTDNFKIQNSQILKPGEQLVYNKLNNRIELKDVNTKLFTSWKDNKLIFINMSLEELITLLERKYGVDIEVADSSILNYHYDGTIRDETILQVLDIIKETLPIQYKIEGQKIKIIKSNKSKK